MSPNKNALLRLQIIDECLSKRKYTIEELHKACNSRLHDKVTDRVIRDDVVFLQTKEPNGFGAPIKRERVGKTYLHSYTDPSYSIRGKKLNLREIEHIQTALAVLTRFRGIPGTEWVESTMSRLEAITGDSSAENKYISIQNNISLGWIDKFKTMMDAIPKQKALLIKYQAFRDTISKEYIFSPYYLKEYNTRWFVLGQCPSYGTLTIFALDRITQVVLTDHPYIPNTDGQGNVIYDFEFYFEDVLGVTLKADKPAEKVLLKIRNDSWPYIETKPLHGSQKRWKDGDEENYTGIQLELQINYELIANILYRGSAIKVVAPASLIAKIKSEVAKLHEYYQ